MLKLEHIVKVYETTGEKVTALHGIDLSFRESEFVAILGHSGCGKTTMLNIIGGLDQYTSGDLVINGRSTKEFKDSDWDTYRNHSIGFVFQSYNLIPHQSVLANVELALTLSGVSKAERRRRAAEALEKVGLADQMKKKPNQLSGGQMQRVAIARALVNDPDILLADEPTGALDSDTSVQVMDLLAEIAKEKLVIMVTHNPELAEQYASRIIRIKDGVITSDSMPYQPEHEEPPLTGRQAKSKNKTSMSFFTAFALSLNNLMTKKGRTILTSFAGSIGIIGIALILALSTGINNYINQVQEETLSSYPITIEAESVDMSAMMASMMGARLESDSTTEREEGRVYASTVMYDMLDSMMHMEVSTNNLHAFKKYLDNGGGGISDLATIQYSYKFPFDVYTADANGVIVKSDLQALIEDAFSAMTGGGTNPMMANMESMSSMSATLEVWEELLAGQNGELISDQLKNQYDLIHGHWPENFDEVILFVSENNEISDLMLVSLGLVPSAELEETLAILGGKEGTINAAGSWSYEELCDMQYKLILPSEAYRYDTVSGSYVDMSATDAGMELLYNSSDVGTPLKVVGIARPNEEATATMVTGAIGYTSALTEYAIRTTSETEVIQAQLADKNTDVTLALPFLTDDYTEPTDEEKQTSIVEYLSNQSVSDKAAAYVDVMSQPSDAYIAGVVAQQTAELTREAIENMIVQQYAAEMGVDAETIMGYIVGMSDEELFAQVEKAIAEQVREQYAQGVIQQMAAMPQEQLAQALDLLLSGDPAMLAYANLSPLTAEQFVYLYDNYMPPTYSESTYEDNLDKLGYVDLADPATISIYATTFADKDQIADLIAEYNSGVEEDDKIEYTDYVALLMSSITAIISGISYLLIAFVSISLVVSSIMIGVITLISVQERTKEIGILRAVGASKRDVSRVFNAETFIVGLCAGLVGIGTSLLLTLPINAILLHFTGLLGLKATLPWQASLILIAISAILTIIAGLIPSRVAAKKDPVVALRTE